MPVDPVSLDSSLRLVCGSHRWGRWFKPRKFATESDYISDVFSHTYESVPVEEIESGKYHILQWAMQVGSSLDTVVSSYQIYATSIWAHVMKRAMADEHTFLMLWVITETYLI